MNPFEAESEAEKNKLLLPSEEDMSELGADPSRLPDPASLVTTPGVNRRKQRTRKQDAAQSNWGSEEQFQKWVSGDTSPPQPRIVRSS